MRRLYRFMEQHETDDLVEKINRQTHVQAWYSPVCASGLSFNKIRGSTCDVRAGRRPEGLSR